MSEQTKSPQFGKASRDGVGCVVRLVIGICALVLASFAFAVELQHNVRFDTFGLEDGLTQETVYDIIQDRDGIIWMATQEGLNRYDGYEIQAFLHDPEDGGSISHDWVWTVFEDSRGSLWVGTDGGGLNRYDPVSGRFEQFRHVEGDPNSLAHDVVRVITEDTDGWLWLGTDAGISSFNPDTGRFSNFHLDPGNGLRSDKVRAILQDRRGLLWIATDGGGLSQMDPIRRNFRHFGLDQKNPNSLSTDRLRSLFEANDGMLWIGTYDGGLNRYNPRTGRFKHYRGSESGLGSNFVRDIYQDHRGVLWVATDNGLHEYRPESDTFVRYAKDLANPRSLSDNRTISIFQDSGDVLWIGTYAGVNKWNYQTIAFRLYRSTEDNGLSNDTILSFAEDSTGVWWVGAYDGLYYYTQQTGIFTHVQLSGSDLITGHPVTALAIDDQDRVWIGTRSNGLVVLDQASGDWKHFAADPENPKALAVGGITTIRHAKGQVWVGTFGGGLYRYDSATQEFRSHRHDPADSASLPSDRVISVEVTADGEVWLGTFGAGVAVLNSDGETFTNFRTGADKKSLSNDTIWALHEDNTGNLWFGTQGGGLSMLPKSQRGVEKPSFSRFGRRQGLRSLVVYGVLSDEQGNIWLSSNRGIARLIRTSGRINHYDVHHGLQSYEFNAGAYMKTRRGELVFGGSRGFNAFFPSEVRTKEYSPPVILTNIFKVNEAIKEPAAVHRLEELVLTAADYLVTFEFAGLDFSMRETGTYQYMLAGYDQSWIESATVRRASYTNLPAGNYRFMVRAAGSSGIWSSEGVNLPVRVLPPWYLSGTAFGGYLAIFVLAIFGAFGLHRRRLYKEAQRSRELEVEVNNRTEELAARTGELEERNTDLRNLNAKLEQSSITDHLTGLNNRLFVTEFMQRTTGALDRRLEKLPLSSIQQSGPRIFLLLIDIDRFRELNERFGSEFGDSVLKLTGQCLRGICRGADLAARWSGDQFVMIGETTQPDAISEVASRVIERVSEVDHRPEGEAVQHIAVSCGLSFYPFSTLQPHLFSWEQVTAIADRALNIGKQSGGSRCITITSGQQSLSRIDLKRILDDPDGLETSGGITIDRGDVATSPVTLDRVRSELETIGGAKGEE